MKSYYWIAHLHQCNLKQQSEAFHHTVSQMRLVSLRCFQMCQMNFTTSYQCLNHHFLSHTTRRGQISLNVQIHRLPQPYFGCYRSLEETIKEVLIRKVHCSALIRTTKYQKEIELVSVIVKDLVNRFNCCIITK